MAPPLLVLPDELLDEIFKPLKYLHRLHLAGTCKRLRTIAPPYIFTDLAFSIVDSDEPARSALQETRNYGHFTHKIKINTHSSTRTDHRDAGKWLCQDTMMLLAQRNTFFPRLTWLVIQFPESVTDAKSEIPSARAETIFEIIAANPSPDSLRKLTILNFPPVADSPVFRTEF
ncbi:hypothetical protein DM02DRAFT_335167 [Periconia macrospinosa]|uniref:F-box domain-containing protein n=1 Tax=Periconia macrospinosa TaxID=97972 RepID=A0A2V1D0L9_9PLEO|nr:hypothetical protein DM02DRAFT_335167 [Periconia macrospinosa]